MTDRGSPIVGGAPACPFVAFEDDRDARSGGADHRHRCFAEVRAAPRALAHQEAFCLSAAFPACPTFQDWARREAASIDAAREADDAPSAEAGRSSGARSASETPTDPNRRNPPRDWAAPPPWLSGSRSSGRGAGRPDAAGDPIRGALDDDADDGPVLPPPGGGLSGSFADRIVSGAGDPFTERPPVAGRAAPPPPAIADVELDDDDPDEDAGPSRAGTPTTRASIPRHLGPGTSDKPRQPTRDGVARRTPDPAAPAWERPRRLEAYPTIRSRRLPSLGGSSVIIGFVAVLLAAAALFFLPGILGLGNETPDPTATPSASASPTATAATPSLAPTDEPLPTGDRYIVEPGDTMSKIANKFGIPLSLLIEANKETIPDPDALQIGDEVIIPSLPPTSIPGASPSSSGSPAP